MQLLVVEDERRVRASIARGLREESFLVLEASDGAVALETLAQGGIDLALLDWMLPGISGIELCRRLRQREETQRLPVIMLTARGEEADRVRGLETGADDYVVKPFSVSELVARVGAVLRRANPARTASVLQVGDVELNREAMSVVRGGAPIHIGPTDFRLLEFLMQSPGRVFTREQLLDGVWGNEVYVDERTVDVHIGRLRKALSGGWKTDPIATVRGAGYRFETGGG